MGRQGQGQAPPALQAATLCTWLLTLLSTACQSPSPLVTRFSLKIKAKVFTGPILAFSRELKLGPRQTLAIAGLLGTHHLTSWRLVTMPTATRVTGRRHSLSMDSAHLVPGRALASVPFLSHKPFLVPCHIQWDPLTDDIRQWWMSRVTRVFQGSGHLPGPTTNGLDWTGWLPGPNLPPGKPAHTSHSTYSHTKDPG